MRATTVTRITLAAGLALAVGGPALAQTPVNERRPAAPDAVVAVENVAGSVEVVGWDRPELEVTGTLARDAERCEVSGEAGNLRVRVVVPKRIREVEGSALTVKVPAGCRLDVDAVAASIEVSGLTGRLELESVSGDVTVRGRPAALDADTVSGDLEVEAAPTGCQLESVSGDVTVSSATGSIEASSVSGDVVVAGGVLERAELQTTSGNLRLAADLRGPGPFELESMSGAVVLEVPAAVVASFELETFSGEIDSALGPKPGRASEHGPGQELEFSTGSGGPRVSASSFSGTVTLTTR